MNLANKKAVLPALTRLSLSLTLARLIVTAACSAHPSGSAASRQRQNCVATNHTVLTFSHSPASHTPGKIDETTLHARNHMRPTE